ncbi:helix-turn-helix domain-containing protein [Mycobacterium sp. 050134]|uniref:helix-turn-helix domain-containing protein n=1 Tax=Mycobacterium sp. 050134 TaxID=3096111 RepID=UPI002EDACC61
MFVDEPLNCSMSASDMRIVRFGDLPGGKPLTFEVAKPASSLDELSRGRSPAARPSYRSSVDTDEPGADSDPGLARAGAAAAARRRELDISQRRLAAEGIINAGALIAFEKGRSWPRERTRAKLEQVLQWPAGTIVKIRRGEPVSGRMAPQAARRTEDIAADGAEALIAQAVVAAVDSCQLAITALPPTNAPDFIERMTPILADLRQLEAIVVRATHISRITPELIKALSTVRHHYDNLMTLGALAPGAPLAQRLYAARRRANLSTVETALAAGVTEETIVRAEAEEAVPVEAADAIETLIAQIH